MSEPVRRYTNGEITVIWNPAKCVHSGICVRGLPRVFNLRQKPWVNMLQATTDEIRGQVDRCPSGALSWEENEE